jgi:hypothetical protein
LCPQALAKRVLDHKRVDVGLDIDAEGGDGIAGQVIGSATSGVATVLASSNSDHSSARGGDAKVLAVVNLTKAGAIASRAGAAEQSASSETGDGVGVQVSGGAGLFVATSQPVAGGSHDMIGQAFEVDIGPGLVSIGDLSVGDTSSTDGSVGLAFEFDAGP